METITCPGQQRTSLLLFSDAPSITLVEYNHLVNRFILVKALDLDLIRPFIFSQGFPQFSSTNNESFRSPSAVSPHTSSTLITSPQGHSYFLFLSFGKHPPREEKESQFSFFTPNNLEATLINATDPTSSTAIPRILAMISVSQFQTGCLFILLEEVRSFDSLLVTKNLLYVHLPFHPTDSGYERFSGDPSIFRFTIDGSASHIFSLDGSPQSPVKGFFVCQDECIVHYHGACCDETFITLDRQTQEALLQTNFTTTNYPENIPPPHKILHSAAVLIRKRYPPDTSESPIILSTSDSRLLVFSVITSQTGKAEDENTPSQIHSPMMTTKLVHCILRLPSGDSRYPVTPHLTCMAARNLRVFFACEDGHHFSGQLVQKMDSNITAQSQQLFNASSQNTLNQSSQSISNPSDAGIYVLHIQQLLQHYGPIHQLLKGPFKLSRTAQAATKVLPMFGEQTSLYHPRFLAVHNHDPRASPTTPNEFLPHTTSSPLSASNVTYYSHAIATSQSILYPLKITPKYPRGTKQDFIFHVDVSLDPISRTDDFNPISRYANSFLYCQLGNLNDFVPLSTMISPIPSQKVDPLHPSPDLILNNLPEFQKSIPVMAVGHTSDDGLVVITRQSWTYYRRNPTNDGSGKFRWVTVQRWETHVPIDVCAVALDQIALCSGGDFHYFYCNRKDDGQIQFEKSPPTKIAAKITMMEFSPPINGDGEISLDSFGASQPRVNRAYANILKNPRSTFRSKFMLLSEESNIHLMNLIPSEADHSDNTRKLIKACTAIAILPVISYSLHGDDEQSWMDLEANRELPKNFFNYLGNARGRFTSAHSDSPGSSSRLAQRFMRVDYHIFVGFNTSQIARFIVPEGSKSLGPSHTLTLGTPQGSQSELYFSKILHNNKPALVIHSNVDQGGQNHMWMCYQDENEFLKTNELVAVSSQHLVHYNSIGVNPQFSVPPGSKLNISRVISLPRLPPSLLTESLIGIGTVTVPNETPEANATIHCVMMLLTINPTIKWNRIVGGLSVYQKQLVNPRAMSTQAHLMNSTYVTASRCHNDHIVQLNRTIDTSSFIVVLSESHKKTSKMDILAPPLQPQCPRVNVLLINIANTLTPLSPFQFEIDASSKHLMSNRELANMDRILQLSPPNRFLSATLHLFYEKERSLPMHLVYSYQKITDTGSSYFVEATVIDRQKSPRHQYIPLQTSQPVYHLTTYDRRIYSTLETSGLDSPNSEKPLPASRMLMPIYLNEGMVFPYAQRGVTIPFPHGDLSLIRFMQFRKQSPFPLPPFIPTSKLQLCLPPTHTITPISCIATSSNRIAISTSHISPHPHVQPFSTITLNAGFKTQRGERMETDAQVTTETEVQQMIVLDFATIATADKFGTFNVYRKAKDETTAIGDRGLRREEFDLWDVSHQEDIRERTKAKRRIVSLISEKEQRRAKQMDTDTASTEQKADPKVTLDYLAHQHNPPARALPTMNCVSSFFVGEQITAFDKQDKPPISDSKNRSSYNADKRDPEFSTAVYYGTEFGAIGAFFVLASDRDVNEMFLMEFLIRRALCTNSNALDDPSTDPEHGYSTLCGVNPLTYRGRHRASRDIVDGDLLLYFFQLDHQVQDRIAFALGKSRDSLMKQLEYLGLAMQGEYTK
ncbi:hypothetical protein BLNAU_2573 [Blattamonas nauphoetae]|uniref:RSE1/DDB1/CPSF1 C-terminal domain-containing protein n=1 Tax=Blattamonas nauphoetae TaxID=2049346 RepID=A0ABQ9YFA3_9EUKA|nr:hypothetical protein BLNAU_2573 [Blattamonas nauphoetae]